MKKLLIVVSVTLLCGCAGLNFSYNLSYNMPQTAVLANPSLPAVLK